jgi:hypothetical protein
LAEKTRSSVEVQAVGGKPKYGVGLNANLC